MCYKLLYKNVLLKLGKLHWEVTKITFPQKKKKKKNYTNFPYCFGLYRPYFPISKINYTFSLKHCSKLVTKDDLLGFMTNLASFVYYPIVLLFGTVHLPIHIALWETYQIFFTLFIQICPKTASNYPSTCFAIA